MGESDWPVELRGVTESLVATLGPNNRYNLAALGLHSPEQTTSEETSSPPVRARTWGRTRTWRNFREQGCGVVQFTRDPVVFVDAALAVHEQDVPVHSSADAWVTVTVEKRDEGRDGGTQWVEWELHPEKTGVTNEVVPTFNRGYAAVIEATVAASRLDVESYDTETLRERITDCGSVVERCGGPREREAFDRIRSALSFPVD